MRSTFGLAILALASTASVMVAADVPPPWAYGYTTPPAAGTPQAPPAPAAAPLPPDTSMKSLPGATGQYTRQQIANRFGPADWFPGDHPQMPPVVAQGKQPQVFACSLCHYPNGKGRPENASVNGYPKSYFVQQMMDFRAGNRKSSDPRKTNTGLMEQFAKNMTDDEIKAAADYFGAMKFTPWIRVVETNTVPKTRIQGGMYMAAEGNEKEPIGQRIIEAPEKTEETEVLRDPHSGFIAYVPVGAVKKGEALVTKGGGKTTACATCHGTDLKGNGPVPGLAGRSPSYAVRQMFDMKTGNRKGEWTPLMKPIVANLTEVDMMNIAAYLASLKP
jgi:cytochrome c553